MEILKIQNRINNSHNVQFKAINNKSEIINNETIDKISAAADKYDINIFDRHIRGKNARISKVGCSITRPTKQLKYISINRLPLWYGITHPWKYFGKINMKFKCNHTFKLDTSVFDTPEKMNEQFIKSFRNAIEWIQNAENNYKPNTAKYLKLFKIK